MNTENKEVSDKQNSWDKAHELHDENGEVAAAEFVTTLPADEQRICMARLSGDERVSVVSNMSSNAAATVIEHLAEAQAVEVMSELQPGVAADIIESLPDDLSADLLYEMKSDGSNAVLAQMDSEEEAKQLRELCSYAPDSAGGLMSRLILTISDEKTVADVIERLTLFAEKNEGKEVHYVYVVDTQGKLCGLVQLTNLLFKKQSATIASVMIKHPSSVHVNDDLEALKNIFEEKGFISMPVTNDEEEVVGVVSRRRVLAASAEHQTEDYLHASGIVGGEELRSMPLLTRSRRRLAWLAPNIILNLVAASIIAFYQDTLQAVIALAVFLPIISDMSGCSGNQAVAVSIRELTLGLIRPTEFLRIVWKEGFLGIINGLILGLLLGTIAFLWKSNIWLGCVVGGALFLNTMLSVLLGGMVPLLLKRLKVDPALASGPILTTCTDMCGFFLVLNLASVVLNKLV